MNAKLKSSELYYNELHEFLLLGEISAVISASKLKPLIESRKVVKKKAWYNCFFRVL